jgi:F420-non-reducing hydrogenase iron-sulfur subunit
MCSGRVDPVMIMEGFIAGSDGVFVGACRRGECHYSTGNLHAEGKIDLTRRILEIAGLNPARLAMRMMSSAEGNKFVEFTSAFQSEIGELGPLGEAEGVAPDELKIKLEAARKALGGRKLRWVLGKLVEFREKGNLYGERFTEHEIRRLLEEIAMDEYSLREILERLGTKPHSVRDLAMKMDMPARILLRQMADLRRMGLAEIKGIEANTPVWTAAGDGEVGYE